MLVNCFFYLQLTVDDVAILDFSVGVEEVCSKLEICLQGAFQSRFPSVDSEILTFHSNVDFSQPIGLLSPGTAPRMRNPFFPARRTHPHIMIRL